MPLPLIHANASPGTDKCSAKSFSGLVCGTHQMCKSGSLMHSCPPISISTNDLFVDLVLSSIPIKREDDKAIHSASFRSQTIPPSTIDQCTVS